MLILPLSVTRPPGSSRCTGTSDWRCSTSSTDPGAKVVEASSWRLGAERNEKVEALIGDIVAFVAKNKVRWLWPRSIFPNVVAAWMVLLGILNFASGMLAYGIGYVVALVLTFWAFQVFTRRHGAVILIPKYRGEDHMPDPRPRS